MTITILRAQQPDSESLRAYKKGKTSPMNAAMSRALPGDTVQVLDLAPDEEHSLRTIAYRSAIAFGLKIKTRRVYEKGRMVGLNLYVK